MSHLIVLDFQDSVSAQAARTLIQETHPSELTILDEESFAQFAPKASKALASIPLWVRFPLAMFVGAFAGIYYGVKWFSQTMNAVSNFLGEPQTTTNGQTSYGRAILLIDDTFSETFVNKFEQLGVSIQRVELSPKEEERLRSQQTAQPQAAQPAETQP